jgi:hypothetical protein
MAYRLYCTDQYGVVRTRAFESLEDAESAFGAPAEFNPRWISETAEGKVVRGSNRQQPPPTD